MSVTKDLSTARPALRRTVRAVRPHLKPHGKLVAGGLLAMLAQVGFRLLEPWPIKVVIDTVTLPDATVTTSTLLLMGVMGLAIVAAAAGRAVAEYGSTIAFALAGTRAATSIRAQVFEHVQRLSLRQHGTLRTGDLVQRMIGDVGRLQEVAVMAGLPLVGNVVTFVAMVGVMLWLDPLLTVGGLLATVLFLVMNRRRSPPSPRPPAGPARSRATSRPRSPRPSVRCRSCRRSSSRTRRDAPSRPPTRRASRRGSRPAGSPLVWSAGPTWSWPSPRRSCCRWAGGGC
jgi:ABC-type multidrug transport system fused ATPase/permease subunit